MSTTCIARPLIYVDVSLHSNKKKQKSNSACVSWMLLLLLLLLSALKDAVSVSQSGCQSKPSVGSVALCGLIRRGHEWHWNVASSSLSCAGPMCFLATQTLHIITCSSLQMKYPKLKFAGATQKRVTIVEIQLWGFEHETPAWCCRSCRQCKFIKSQMRRMKLTSSAKHRWCALCWR